MIDWTGLTKRDGPLELFANGKRPLLQPRQHRHHQLLVRNVARVLGLRKRTKANAAVL